MLLEPEVVAKRIAIVSGAIIVALAAGATVWYNTNLKNIFLQNITETTGLRQETAKLSVETDGLKSTLSATAKEFKSFLAAGAEETKKLDGELKSQTLNIKATNQELEKLRADIRAELQKIRDSHSAAVATLQDQIKVRDANLEKYKADRKIEVHNLAEQLSIKEREVTELRAKLDVEVEWRKKNFWGRN